MGEKYRHTDASSARYGSLRREAQESKSLISRGRVGARSQIADGRIDASERPRARRTKTPDGKDVRKKEVEGKREGAPKRGIASVDRARERARKGRTSRGQEGRKPEASAPHRPEETSEEAFAAADEHQAAPAGKRRSALSRTAKAASSALSALAPSAASDGRIADAGDDVASDIAGRAKRRVKKTVRRVYEKRRLEKKGRAAEAARADYKDVREAAREATLQRRRPPSAQPNAANGPYRTAQGTVKKAGERFSATDVVAPKSVARSQKTIRSVNQTTSPLARANVRRARKLAAQKGGEQAAFAGTRAVAAPVKKAAATAGGAVAKAAVAAAPVILGVLLALILALLAASFASSCTSAIVGSVSASDQEEEKTGSLTGEAALLARFLKNEMGMGDVQIAGIIGNSICETYNGQWKEGDALQISFACQEAPWGDGSGYVATGIGFMQFSGGEADNLRAYAAARGKDWSDPSIQLAFFKEISYNEQWIRQTTSIWTLGAYDEPCGRGDFEAAADPQVAARMFMGGYLRPSYSPSVNHYVNRQNAAAAVLRALRSGSGVGADRMRVVDAAYKYIGCPYNEAPSAATGDSFNCSGLVWWVFEECGYQIPHAQALYNTSGWYNGRPTQSTVIRDAGRWIEPENWEDLKPGDLVFFGDSWDVTGHVGIYIGGGQMIDAVPGGVAIRTIHRSGFVGGGDPVGFKSGSALAEKAVAAAWTMVGKPYILYENYAAGGYRGTDCNGLAYYVWHDVCGIELPHWSGSHGYGGGQYQYLSSCPGWKTRIEDLVAGDVIFYSCGNGPGYHHVALYVGDGMTIQAISPSQGIQYVSVYFCSGFQGGACPDPSTW